MKHINKQRMGENVCPFMICSGWAKTLSIYVILGSGVVSFCRVGVREESFRGTF